MTTSIALLPDADHVGRFCKPYTLDDDGNPGSSAFKLRPDEPYLSVNWLEKLGVARDEQIREFRRVFSKKFTMGHGRIAVSGVSRIRDRCAGAEFSTITVGHYPEPEDDSHAGVSGYRPEDDMVADALWECFSEIHLARVPAL